MSKVVANLPVLLSFYDTISDLIYFETVRFDSRDLKVLCLTFLLISPLVQLLCWTVLLFKHNMKPARKQENLSDSVLTIQ